MFGKIEVGQIWNFNLLLSLGNFEFGKIHLANLKGMCAKHIYVCIVVLFFLLFYEPVTNEIAIIHELNVRHDLDNTRYEIVIIPYTRISDTHS